MPISNHRKYCIWRILAPYFINVKHLSFDDSYDKIYQWLDRCNELKKPTYQGFFAPIAAIIGVIITIIRFLLATAE